jgi:RIO-like serine/threonine protein kinase
VRLVQPTDFLILDALYREGRNVAPNLAHHTGKIRENINTRLPVLADYGLVSKVGPAENAGLYEITATGKLAVENEAKYGTVDDFGDFLTQMDSL